MNCRDIADLLTQLVFDDFEDAAQREYVEGHLRECSGCRHLYADMKATAAVLEEGLRDGDAPVLDESHRTAIAEAAPRHEREPGTAEEGGEPTRTVIGIPMPLLFRLAAVFAVLLVLAGLIVPALNRVRETNRTVAYDRVQDRGDGEPGTEYGEDKLAGRQTMIKAEKLTSQERPATVAMDQDVLVEEPDSTLRDDGVGAVPAGKPEVAMKTVGDEHGEPEMQATRRALDDRAPALGRAPAAAPKEPAAAFSRSQSVQMEMEEAAADGVGATRTVPREAPGSGFAALREETRLAEGGALAAARMRTEAVSENANEKADRELSFAAAARVQPLVKVREYLERGEWPPPNAVHAVALIDSFQYVYLQPADGTFRITVSMMPSPFHEDLTILSVGIQARKGNGVVLEKAGLGSTLPIVADNVNVRVEYTPDRVRRYHRFADETKKTFRAGSIVDPLHVGPWAAGHALTLLYELELTEGYVSAGNDQNLGVVHVEYQDPTDKKTIEIAEYFGKNGVSKDGFKESPGLVLAACVGEFAMIVNRGEDAYKGELAEVQRQLQTLGKAISQNSDLQELMQLVNQARRVAVGREEE